MDWYFSTNESSLDNRNDDWKNLIVAAVKSAAANTKLTPHLIYDGNPNPFIRYLEGLGVRVIRHRSRLYEFIKAVMRSQGNSDPGFLQIASSAFLRVDLPTLVGGEFVLYTDCDVMFRSDPGLDHLRPRYFACAPESNRGDYSDLNTGVMLMNLGTLRKCGDDFERFIKLNFEKMDTYDQTAYRLYFGDKYDLIADENNWKPYWGLNPGAKIVHFHGPKPKIAKQLAGDPGFTTHAAYHVLYERDPKAYAHYVEEWSGYAQSPWVNGKRSRLSRLLNRLGLRA